MAWTVAQLVVFRGHRCSRTTRRTAMDHSGSEQPTTPTRKSATATMATTPAITGTGATTPAATGTPTKVTIPVFEKEALQNAIERLKIEQKDMRAAKKKLSKDLRNAEKRRARLKRRARQLSDADLVALLQMRGSINDGDSNHDEEPGSSSGLNGNADAMAENNLSEE